MGDKFAAALAGDDDDKQMITAADVYGKGGALMPRRDVIKREADGTLTYKRTTMTPVGLVMPEDMSADELVELGTVLRGMESSIQWLLGDWLNRADRVWGQVYSVDGWNYNLLRDYAYVARNVEMSVRTDKLSFGHHKLVAAMPAGDQQAWLEWAETNRASIAQMRKAIKDAMRGEAVGETFRGVDVQKQAVSWAKEVVKQAQNIEKMDVRDRQRLHQRAQWLADYYRKIAERAK